MVFKTTGAIGISLFLLSALLSIIGPETYGSLRDILFASGWVIVIAGWVIGLLRINNR